MTEERLRLHITPFSKAIAQSLLATQPTLTVDSISHHTIETFPENSYGYIELPSVEAERLKRKMNGSILRGKKLRVENAHPQNHTLDMEKSQDESSSTVHEPSKSSKRLREPDADLKGHELEQGRKVKRGWTDPDKAKRKSSTERGSSSSIASKHTDKAECMFRVRVPPNKEVNIPSSTNGHKDRDKRKTKQAAVIHEFEKSTRYPSFIKQPVGNRATGESAEYIEGKGWIDTDGNLVEEDKRSMRTRSRTRRESRGSTNNEATHIPRERNQSSPDNTITASEVKDEPTTCGDEAEDISSSGTSHSEAASLAGSSVNPSMKSKASERAVDVPTVATSAPDDPTFVHPLEAVFKRPNQAASQASSKRPLEIKTSFNFFEPDQGQSIPQTPFTTRDLLQRGLRSAAPTPDTALPTRRFFPEPGSPSKSPDRDINSIEQGPGSGNLEPPQQGEQKEEGGDFRNWFWEHRGENNRAWKRRRKEALKEQQQQESRRKSHRSG
jgi:hypothetical protein